MPTKLQYTIKAKPVSIQGTNKYPKGYFFLEDPFIGQAGVNIFLRSKDYVIE
jgi:hypothetical protein